jgi:hypothetical protein
MMKRDRWREKREQNFIIYEKNAAMASGRPVISKRFTTRSVAGRCWGKSSTVTTYVIAIADTSMICTTSIFRLHRINALHNAE